MSKIVEKEEVAKMVKDAGGSFDKLCSILNRVNRDCASIVIDAIIDPGCGTTNFLSAIKFCVDRYIANMLISSQAEKGVKTLEAAYLYRRCISPNQENSVELYEKIFKGSLPLLEISDKTSFAELKIIASLLVEGGNYESESILIEKGIITTCIARNFSAQEIASLAESFNTNGGNRLITDFVNSRSVKDQESAQRLYLAIKGDDTRTKISVLSKAADLNIQPESIIRTCLPVIMINL